VLLDTAWIRATVHLVVLVGLAWYFRPLWNYQAR
jgi:hypothetical protein